MGGRGLRRGGGVAAGGRTVAAVMVDGEAVVMDGHSTRISEEDLVRRLLRSSPERVGAPGQR
ncbi:hypothetical protein AB0M10_14670 [Streptomyces sp. NPDC051840]|uniref:hypothetical protein n=1 Tax=unclassified Streptomyces TaxID=2593676 RepID=UPI00343B6526